MTDFIPNSLNRSFQAISRASKENPATKPSPTTSPTTPPKTNSSPNLFKQNGSKYLQANADSPPTMGLGLRNFLGLGLGKKNDDFAVLSAAQPSPQTASQTRISDAFNPDLLPAVNESAPLSPPAVCRDLKTCEPGSVRPPIYAFDFAPSKMRPFPEARSLKGPLATRTGWLSQLEKSHRGYNLEIFHNGIPFGALKSALGKYDNNQDAQLNLDEAKRAGVLNSTQADALKQLARSHQLMPADPKNIDAVALGKALETQGVTIPADLANALSDLEVLNHYLGQADIAPEEIILQADPKARATSKSTLTMKDYAETTIEQKAETKEEYSTAKLKYLKLKSEVRSLEQNVKTLTGKMDAATKERDRLIARNPSHSGIPSLQAKMASLQTELTPKIAALAAKKALLSEKGNATVEGVYAKGGTVVDKYIIGPQTPEQKAVQFGDIYDRRAQQGITDGYKHDNVGCAALTDLLHTLVLGREINVQKMLELTQSSDHYGPVQVTHTPGTRTTPFAKDKPNPADPSAKPQEENLQALFDQDVLKPGMVLFINTDSDMRLTGENADKGNNQFGSSDRHWFTYMGKSGETPIFLDNTGTKYTLQQMINHYQVGREDNIGTPTVLHTVFDFYPSEAEREKFKAFAQKLLGNSLQ
jgi:hypothetical protein